MPGLLGLVVRSTSLAPDEDGLLERAAQVVLTAADWVVADRLDEPDLLTRVVAVGRDGPLPLLHRDGGVAPRRSSAGVVGMLPALLAAPGRALRLTAAGLERAAAGPEPHLAAQAALALRLGTRDLLLLGLVARDRVQGVLALGSGEGFPDAVADELTEVALHVGLALDAVRLRAAQRAVATAMQTSLLPPVPRADGLELAARYAPALHELEVGGDWYDAFPTLDGLVVVVGDVRGHDLAAAAQMADLRNLLRALAVDREETPAALLRRLERTVTALGLDVAATCVLGLVRRSAQGWELVWSSAGHLPPVLACGGRARLLETEADLMLGVDPQAARTDHVQRLEPGDTLVLCTDGLVEVRTAALEDRLQVLRATVEAGATGSADLLAEQLLALGSAAEDDVALLVLRVLAPPG